MDYFLSKESREKREHLIENVEGECIFLAHVVDAKTEHRTRRVPMILIGLRAGVRHCSLRCLCLEKRTERAKHS